MQPSSVPSDYLQELSKRECDEQEAIWEIVTTERRYINVGYGQLQPLLRENGLASPKHGGPGAVLDGTAEAAPAARRQHSESVPQLWRPPPLQPAVLEKVHPSDAEQV